MEISITINADVLVSHRKVSFKNSERILVEHLLEPFCPKKNVSEILAFNMPNS